MSHNISFGIDIIEQKLSSHTVFDVVCYYLQTLMSVQQKHHHAKRMNTVSTTTVPSPAKVDLTDHLVNIFYTC